MSKKSLMCKIMEKLTTGIALSSAAMLIVTWCTVVMHQPEIPEKLKRQMDV